ncbi:MAG: flagellin [Paracoccaceae bacterium]|nr:flagellin [Paracoccaceae bacterium]
MALSIATNTSALDAAAAAASVSTSLETSMERLSTGKRINSASDDAAGVAIASRLSSEIRGTNQSIRNALDAQALMDTAEGAHKEVENILQRMREIAVQAANDTNNTQDRLNMQKEINAMVNEVDRIAEATTWAGTNLLLGDGTSNSEKAFSFQVGAAKGTQNQINVAVKSLTASTLGLSALDLQATVLINDADITSDVGLTVYGFMNNAGNFLAARGGNADSVSTMSFTVDINGQTSTAFSFTSDTELFGDTTGPTTANIRTVHNEIAAKINANTNLSALGISADVEGTGSGSVNLLYAETRVAVSTIDKGLKTINTQRAELGAVSNRLNHTVNNLTNMSANLSAARGCIEDADFALETTELAKNQILQQASTAMLAQANASKQNVLGLLRS